jgi:hypothetical protein
MICLSFEMILMSVSMMVNDAISSSPAKSLLQSNHIMELLELLSLFAPLVDDCLLILIRFMLDLFTETVIRYDLLC